ncbi:hypothetical protein M9H77_15101 [Catharanthus roseus]|uniref:Uncharacterized protein n=1 Tax=Catharanthus roseus TaxID=4058 RepID=A0ACC0BPZ7_CATRO|nr:hypothetical protein M9H77_15101 [Catharanthus roseus]
MWKFRPLFGFLLLCSVAALVAAQGSTSKWQTLGGDAPLVIARGGFSGIFPASSYNAYMFALGTGLQNTILWCDVQLTKDGVGICFPDIKLDNGSDISVNQKNKQKTYLVNGVPTTGWFSIDYTFKELQLLNLKQGIYSRTSKFDETPQQILTVQDVATQIKPPAFWLNVQHDAFFAQHNLSMRSFIISASRSVVVNYISSPEVNFLKSIVPRFRQSATKLVFQFLGPNEVEPSTNQTYGSLLKNLTFVKTFASGILVPKYYIWPLDTKQYLLPSTSLVLDAHKEGLEVYASGFANDVDLPYNVSYDPLVEYLSFIDNGNFSVDGVLSDFPITPSAAIDCFSHMGKNETVQANVLVISKEGASGDYPGCTDMAYSKAISDGADIIDCPVQMTQDGIPICLGSINLIERTTAAETPFINLTMSIPEINVQDGICSFNLTWSQIQENMQPSMYNPFVNYTLYRNPNFRNSGKFIQLSDFLALANNASSISGVLIGIENAAFLAQNGLDVVGAVLDTLNKSGFSNQTSKKILIASTESPVLKKIGKRNNFELVYRVSEDIRDVTNSTILEMKKFASSVIIGKRSVFPTDQLFLTGATEVVPKLQAFDLAAYVEPFSNEFVSQAWDFFSDPYVEINTFSTAMGINAIITDYPATSARYKRNRCLGYKQLPPYMSPVEPGSLIQLIAPPLLPPAEAPNPVLTENDVIEPPLPPVVVRPPSSNTNTTAPTPTSPSGQSALVATTFMSVLAILLVTFVAS